MKSGICPKCGSREVHSQMTGGRRGTLSIGLWRGTALLRTYVCTDCGYLEEYDEDADKWRAITEEWLKAGE